MDITQAYAIATGGSFIIIFLVNLISPFLPYIGRLVRHLSVRLAYYTSLFVLRHISYPYLIHRHRFVGPWSRIAVLLQLLFITVNIFCVSFQVSSISEAGLRAGTLSMINMIPLFAGMHLSVLADLLGMSLRTYRRVHRSAGLISFALMLFHVVVVVASQVSYALDKPQNLFAVIVSVFLVPFAP